MEYKARAGYTVSIDGSKIMLSRLHKGSTTIFSLDEISELRLNRSVYDIPFMEKTVTVYLKNGKKYPIKRLKKNDAVALHNYLLQR